MTFLLIKPNRLFCLTHRYRHTFCESALAALLVATTCQGILGCASFTDKRTDSSETLPARPDRNDIQTRLNLLEQQNEDLRKDLINLSSKHDTLNEKNSTLRRQVELLQRGLKSGIFEWGDTTGLDDTTEKKRVSSKTSAAQLGASLQTSLRQPIVDLPAFTGSTPEGLGQERFPTIELARQQISAQKYPLAAETLERIVASTSKADLQPQALLLLSDCYLKQQMAPQAQKHLTRYFKLWPQDSNRAWAQFLQGKIHVAEGRHQQAREAFQETLALEPQSPLGKMAQQEIDTVP